MIGAAVALLIIAGTAVSQRVMATDSSSAGPERLLTVYDQGVQKTFLTTKTTIGDALKAENITVENGDVVEPQVQSKLVAKNYRINVYRARPITVVDGMHKTTVLTAEQSPKRIVEATGGVLHDEDRTRLERVDQPLIDGGAGVRLAIDRATTFTFTLYGKTFEARTQATTIEELLKEKDITLGPQDGMSLPAATPITQGMSFAVWRNGKQTVTQEEVIARPVEEVKDADRDRGFREVRTPGKDGKKNVTYEIEMRDGKEVSRKEIASVTTQEPVKEIVVVGTKFTAPVISGTCSDWMAAAGVPNSGSANYLIAKESGCNPLSVNRSSGACGIGQSLPCSKMGPVNPDGTSAVSPVGQMAWMNSYVMGRYGSWEAAAAHHQARGWY